MVRETKEVTVQDILDAMKKNGYKWGKGSYYQWIGGEVQACVLGQAALNLQTFGGDVLHGLDDLHPFTHLGSRIIGYNDGTGYDGKATSYEDAVAYAESALAPYKDKIVRLAVKYPDVG